MKEKALKIFLYVSAGWLIGYVHHYAAADMAKRNDALNSTDAVAAYIKHDGPVKRMCMKTTAYSNDPVSINVPKWLDGNTATNKPVKRGIVAADWEVLKPGTKVYIPGYGMAVVEDRGGAVRGNHVDLFMDSPVEAYRWGVKYMDVYVLEDPAVVASAN